MVTTLVVKRESIIHEPHVSFNMLSRNGRVEDEIILNLIETEREASDPATQWLSHEEVFAPLREKYGYEV
ncbi:MAG: hypothetical protein FWC16_04870 [Defluviitaleaceae bacterium]|nr:hypothetical protein [Defluviitaleaceae bacterium]MCL2274240.1 hypothetical protein [Defluviitaleaceae bacterium]